MPLYLNVSLEFEKNAHNGYNNSKRNSDIKSNMITNNQMNKNLKLMITFNGLSIWQLKKKMKNNIRYNNFILILSFSLPVTII